MQPTRRVLLAAAAVLWSSSLPSHCLAASFDCGKASSAVEKLICATPLLSKLDEELSVVYQRAVREAGQDVKGLRASQREWLTQRDRCTTVDCVAGALTQRSAALSQVSVREGVAVNEQAAPAQDRDAGKVRTQDASRLPVLAPKPAPAAEPPPVPPKAAPAAESAAGKASVDLKFSPFYCEDPFLPIEKLACSSPTLRKLDSEYALLFAKTLETSGASQKEELRRWQLDWETKLRHTTCVDQRVGAPVTSTVCASSTPFRHARELRRSLGIHASEIPEVARDDNELIGKLYGEGPLATPSPESDAEVTYRRPHNLSGSPLCMDPPFNLSRFILCDRPKGESFVNRLGVDAALKAWNGLVPSVRPSSAAPLLAPARRFLDEAMKRCPPTGVDPYFCLDQQTYKVAEQMREVQREYQSKRGAAEDEGAAREQARIAASPVYAYGELGNTGRAGEVWLWLENRTKKGFSRVDVACTLHKYFPNPVESTELRVSFTATVAPESRNSYQVVRPPWDDVKWYREGARKLSCRTLATVEATALETKLAIEKREADKEALDKKVAAWGNAMVAASERREAEVSTDQAERLTAALREANRASSQCQAMARAFVPQLQAVRQYQSVGASAVGVVDAVVVNLRRSGCLN